MNGIIFDIKEFAIYDGPGVRQTVFMKGCPLRCAWCHNPEGGKGHPELFVSMASCTNCRKCFQVCPNSKTWNQRFGRSESCNLCGRCIAVCPMGIRRMTGKRYSAEELAGIIMEKASYYDRYNGGVTFSGGEPLSQSQFLCEVLDLLPDIHKAIETSGYAETEEFVEVVKRLDYVILDIKCMEDELHKQYTGVSNARILQNYKLLRQMEKPHTVRVPLISGISDTRKNLEQTAKLLLGDAFLEKVELLPYQKTAGAKYAWLGRDYTPAFDTERQVNATVEVFEQYGLRCDVL